MLDASKVFDTEEYVKLFQIPGARYGQGVQRAVLRASSISRRHRGQKMDQSQHKIWELARGHHNQGGEMDLASRRDGAGMPLVRKPPTVAQQMAAVGVQHAPPPSEDCSISATF